MGPVWDVQGIREEILSIIAGRFNEAKRQCLIDDNIPTRDKFVNIRLSEKERNRLRKHARWLGVSQSDYIRTSIDLLHLLTLLLMKGVRDEEISEEDRTTLGK